MANECQCHELAQYEHNLKRIHPHVCLQAIILFQMIVYTHVCKIHFNE